MMSSSSGSIEWDVSTSSNDQSSVTTVIPSTSKHDEQPYNRAAHQQQQQQPHLEGGTAAWDCSRFRELHELHRVRENVVRWRWLCSPICQEALLFTCTAPSRHAQAGEHASVAVSRAGLKDAVMLICEELQDAFNCDLSLSVAFLQNGVYETQWKDAHILAIGFAPSEAPCDVLFAPLHYDLHKKVWIDMEEDQWGAFVWLSSYGQRLVRVQPNASPRMGASPFQITEYEVYGNGMVDPVHMWKKFGMWSGEGYR